MVSKKHFDMLSAGLRSVVPQLNEPGRLIRFARFPWCLSRFITLLVVRLCAVVLLGLIDVYSTGAHLGRQRKTVEISKQYTMFPMFPFYAATGYYARTVVTYHGIKESPINPDFMLQRVGIGKSS